MAEFDADKLNAELEQLNREKLAVLEELTEQVLREMRAQKPTPKRADEGRVVIAAVPTKEQRRSGGSR